MSLNHEENIEMGKGSNPQLRLRTLRLAVVALLLAMMAAVAGLFPSDQATADLPPASFLASHTGGTTGGG
jgi:hypothetical protein